MMRFLWLFIVGCFLWQPLDAQTNRKIKDLQNKRGELQKKIVESESLLKSTKKDVKSQLGNLALINGQILERKNYIQSIEGDMQSLDKDIDLLTTQISQLQADLMDKKAKYESSVKYMYKNRSIQEKLMFIFSAQSLQKAYRRMRYVQEYATYQKVQGDEIKKRESQIQQKKKEVLGVRSEKDSLLQQHQQERVKLESQEREQEQILNGLKKKQRTIQTEISKQRKEADALNARIDQLIAIEVEAARKRAEAEARRREAARKEAARKEALRKEAERKRAAELAAKKKANTETAAPSKNRAGNRTVEPKSEELEAVARKDAPMESYDMDNSDRRLSGTFEKNRGRLPMPITGAYVIVGRYGSYSVSGLSNVRLDNKGIDIKGKQGAQARAIFDGEVSAVFQVGGLSNVIVRHGTYMSVYCNLSAVYVRGGQHVSIRQSLGLVHTDGSGNTVLHFQLRREKSKLNPESWLGR